MITPSTEREVLGELLERSVGSPEITYLFQSNIAEAVKSLYDAEHAGSRPVSRAFILTAIDALGRTVAVLQDGEAGHAGADDIVKTLARVLSNLNGLATAATLGEEARVNDLLSLYPGARAITSPADCEG